MELAIMNRMWKVALSGAVVGATFVDVGFASPGDEIRSDEVRALVSEMLADADARSSLLQSSGTAGHDGHFFLASPDGDFKMEIEGQIQFRYLVNHRQAGSGADDLTPGFQTRRTKLVFAGDVYDKFFYKVQGAFSRSSGSFKLEDAKVGYKFDNGVKLQWGQFKLPFLREELVSSKRQLTVDRTFLNARLGQSRSQGAQISYTADRVRVFGAYSDGLKSKNTDLGSEPADYAITGRIEYLGDGSWKQFKDFTSPRGSDFAWMLGAAGHWQKGPDGRPGAIDIERFTWTADASVEGDGWNLYAAMIGNHVNPAVGAGSDEYGWMVQGGVYLTDKLESFVRFEELLPERGPAFNALTIGANYYIHGHAAKFTVDVQYFLDDPAASFISGNGALGDVTKSETGIGFLGSAGQKNEFVLRAQFQLLF